MRKIILSALVIALLSGWCPESQARPHIPAKIAHAVGGAVHAAGNFVAGEGHQRRKARRQSGHGIAKALPRNW